MSLPYPTSFYVQGQPQRCASRWYRLDTFHCRYPDLDGQVDRAWCVDAADDSPIQTRYESVCSYCWLGHCHTAAAHQRSIARNPQE